MSCCHGSVPREVRPGTARVLVTELSGSRDINPTPVSKPCDASAIELSYLSPEKLELLCGTGDLGHVTSLEISVDTQEDTLGDFGVYLPRLAQLRMNNSVITSVRDLGTTLSQLQVLWMSRCSLQELDGISTFSSLKELYLAYNSVSDLSQVGMLENLQLLDLEGNAVDDLVQVQFLGLCGKLQILTLEGNPVCERPNPPAVLTADYNYRAAVRELVPQLRYLDNLRVEEEGRSCTVGEDWDILRNSIRDYKPSQASLEDGETADGLCPHSRPASARRPSSSRSSVRPLWSAGSRPHTGSRPISATRVLSPSGSRPGSADSDLATVEAESSILTHGVGKILFCGNPVQAIRARREKLKTAPTRPTFTLRDLPIHVPEHTYDLEEPDVRDLDDVFAELRAWREQHSRRLRVIEKERLPQVLAIQHGDEDDDEEEEEEEEGFVGVGTDSSDDDEYGEAKRGGSLDTASPDSCFQSLSPDLYHREAFSPDVARLSLSPDPALSPAPPPQCSAATGNRKLPGVRARRLQLRQTDSEHFPDFNGVGGSKRRGADLTLQSNQQVTRTDVPPHVPRPPPTSALAARLIDSRAVLDSSRTPSGDAHLQTPPMSKLPNRPVITRPHTARAALQKHHPHQKPRPCRGSSHPD